MILVWFERSRGDEFDSGNNFQVEKNLFKKSRNTLRKNLELSTPQTISDRREHLNRRGPSSSFLKNKTIAFRILLYESILWSMLNGYEY